MNLYRLIGFDDKAFKMTDGSQIPAYPIIFADSLPSELYEDVTSIVTLNKHWARNYQYIQARGIIFDMVLAIVTPDFSGWSNLSADEKKIATKWIIAPYQLRLTQYSDDEDKASFKTLLEETTGIRKEDLFGRTRVVEEMRQYIALDYYRKELITKVDADDIRASVNTELFNYVNTNSPTFWHWVNNTVGTPYETAGFAQKSYYSSVIKDKLNDIQNYNY